MYSFMVVVSALTTPLLGEISGDVRLGDKYLAAAKIDLKCGDQSAAGVTDSLGTFRLTVKGSGKCTVTVAHDKQTASVDIVVFDKPSRYRLVLELKDGKYILKRV